MATIPVARANPFGSSAVQAPAPANLSTGQTGTGPSTNVADRGSDRGPGMVQIITTVGTALTVAIEGSNDGTNFFPIPYATLAAPATPVVTTFNITTATTTRMFLVTDFAWRYLRLNYSANTNMVITADFFV